jgi:hypothetical protein
MKNIHILPTDKPSRLIYNDANQLCYQSNKSFKNDRKNRKKFNIYITSDEEIKEGDYGLIGKEIGKIIINGDGYEFLMGVAISYEYADFYYLQEVCKKIILTTDQDLIKDGVQPIDDEFLEWFVKNPSCEEVETQLKLPWECSKDEYEIIIPKEEPRILTVEAFNKAKISYKEPKQELPQFGTKEFNDLASQYFGGKPKQETLEEVKDLSYWKANAEEDYMKVPISVLRYISELEEKSYSKKELKEAFMVGHNICRCITDNRDEAKEYFKEWFNKFKKK